MTFLRRLLVPLASAAACACTLAWSAPAQAQEIQLTGPLAGAPAVRQMRYYRQGRFQAAIGPSFTLLDEYRRTIFVSGHLHYNLRDWIAIGVWGGYGLIQMTTDLSDQIDSQAPRNSRTAINVNHGAADSAGNLGKRDFSDQVAKMQWVAAPEVQFIPFRGKLAIFQKLFVDTDAYIHAGLAFVGLQERGDCTTSSKPACTDPASFTLASRTAIAPTFGLGLSFYTSDFISLALEYRALPFSWNRAGFDSRGGGNNNKFPDQKIDSQDQTFKFNQMITLMVGFSLPTKPEVSE